MRPVRDHRRLFALLLVLLLCGALGAVHHRSAQRKQSDPVIRIMRDSVLRPAQTGLVRVSRWWRTYIVSDLHGASLARSNSRLQAQVLALSDRNKQLLLAQAENDRLRALLDFQQRSPRPLLAAEVIALKPVAQTDTLTLNRGSRHNIKPHAVVIAASGALVGQVLDVTPDSCTVLMLTDSGSSVGGQVVRLDSPALAPAPPVPSSGAPAANNPAQKNAGAPPKPAVALTPVGICQGDRSGHLFLTYLRSDADIHPGDLVTTSGLGGVFPKDIPIGTVVSVKIDRTRSIKTALLRPAANLDHLEEAFLLQ